MANSLVQVLIAHFDSVFEGPNGDYPAVLETLAGLSASKLPGNLRRAAIRFGKSQII